MGIDVFFRRLSATFAPIRVNLRTTDERQISPFPVKSLCRTNIKQDPNAGNSRVAMSSATVIGNRERKYADTIGTVLVSWDGHFQC